MATVELYDKGGNLIGRIPIDNERCEELTSMTKDQLLFEVAGMVALAVRAESGLELTLNQVLNELGKVVVCGREEVIDGGNPAV
ncbi:hypothetical protein [Thermovibrio ammonificans]|uniref:Uncharacterized protein n=1 Tax=Thermovibrio ammonificans (strain DSM 15698 / JCM 12110 / HB-1) TaxID=648996 RepID=E8T517_THEA1|nr:hypothetical protein [Thermovibrio ammonificans]ADU97549.1 hypothetical protein Theam_1592 [Thermovibrio ammonificans HB-1]